MGRLASPRHLLQVSDTRSTASTRHSWCLTVPAYVLPQLDVPMNLLSIKTLLNLSGTESLAMDWDTVSTNSGEKDPKQGLREISWTRKERLPSTSVLSRILEMTLLIADYMNMMGANLPKVATRSTIHSRSVSRTRLQVTIVLNTKFLIPT